MINILIDEKSVYNIGGCNERTNLHSIDRICTILDEIKPRHSREGGNPDFNQPSRHSVLDTESTPITDPTSLTTNNDWKTEENFESGIIKVINWNLREYRSI